MIPYAEGLGILVMQDFCLRLANAVSGLGIRV